MNIKTVIVGMLNTNCYIVENDSECIIIDPGDEFENIRNNITKKVVGVVLTHRHFDHIGAAIECSNYYDVDIYSFNNLKEGSNKVGNIEFNVIHNPGHTLDSISFVFKDIMFSGDFIFKGTIGRWDLGGNFSLMQESIRNILKSNVNYKLYPGHGEYTTLNEERENLESYL